MWLIALKRLWHRPWLTVLSVIGLTLAIGLTNSIPLFARAVSFRLLKEELTTLSARLKIPLFSMRVYLYPAGTPLSLDQCAILGQHVQETIVAEVGLPLRQYTWHIESNGLILRPGDQSPQYNSVHRIIADGLNLIVMPGVATHLTIVEGASIEAPPGRDGMLEVWMHRSRADEMGISAGETYELRDLHSSAILPVRVAGTWHATDPRDPYWFGNPDDMYNNMLFVREADYCALAEPQFAQKLGFASWTLVLDDSALSPDRMRDYANGLNKAVEVIRDYLPDAQVDSSPIQALNQAIEREARLTALLFAFTVPLYGFLLYFVALLSTMTVYWQRRETAVLVGRGVNRRQLLRISLVETLLLFALGLPPGILFSARFARWMGYTKSFLSFTWRQPLQVSPRIENLPLLVFCLGTLSLARLWPLLRGTQTSIVAYERTRSRVSQKPWWQRLYLDVLLLVPTAYAYRQLALYGTLVPHEVEAQAPGPMAGQDPLLFLVPALFVLTTSLLAIRAFPLLMRLGDGLCSMSRRATVYMAFRQLSRASSAYSHPLLLVILALGLGAFMASMAASLDQWLADQAYYAVGSDILIQKLIEPGSDAWIIPAEDVLSGAAAAREAAFQRSLVTLPVSTYRDVPGVVWSARVGTYPAQIPVTSGSSVEGTFIGIDRVDLPAVLFDRPDFAATSLGERMNQLAAYENGVLVSEQLLSHGVYQVGDLLSIRLDVDGIPLETGFRIVGTYRYFPTVYPRVGKMVESVRPSIGRRRTPYVPPKYVEVDGPPVVVGNLDYLFGQIGTPVMTGIWLKLAPDADRQVILNHIESKGAQVDEYQDARADLAQSQAQVERVGILGTLTIGFAAATVLSGLGLLIYTYASLQERLFRFTILRAVGLAQGQVVGTVLIEYSVLLLYGILCGAAIGALASQLFIPFFQAADRGVLCPPTLVPEIAWREICWITGVFAALLMSAQVGVIAAALRRGVFRALRLGDQE